MSHHQRNLRPKQGGKFHKPVVGVIKERWGLVPGDLVRIMPGAIRPSSRYHDVTTGVVVVPAGSKIQAQRDIERALVCEEPVVGQCVRCQKTRLLMEDVSPCKCAEPIFGSPERVCVEVHRHASGGSMSTMIDRDSLRLIPPPPTACFYCKGLATEGADAEFFRHVEPVWGAPSKESSVLAHQRCVNAREEAREMNERGQALCERTTMLPPEQQVRTEKGWTRVGDLTSAEAAKKDWIVLGDAGRPVVVKTLTPWPTATTSATSTAGSGRLPGEWMPMGSLVLSSGRPPKSLPFETLKRWDELISGQPSPAASPSEPPRASLAQATAFDCQIKVGLDGVHIDKRGWCSDDVSVLLTRFQGFLQAEIWLRGLRESGRCWERFGPDCECALAAKIRTTVGGMLVRRRGLTAP